MHLITDSLLVGNLDDAQDPSPVIGGLLFVAEEYAIRPPEWMDYARIPFKEFTTPSPDLLAKAVKWIEDHLHRNRVMVCCRAGMGRSVSVVMAYLCCVQGMEYDSVLKLVKTRRPGALPLPALREVIDEVRAMRAAEGKAGHNLPLSNPRCA
jgi:protein-tyrosine phosphatase